MLSPYLHLSPCLFFYRRSKLKTNGLVTRNCGFAYVKAAKKGWHRASSTLIRFDASNTNIRLNRSIAFGEALGKRSFKGYIPSINHSYNRRTEIQLLHHISCRLFLYAVQRLASLRSKQSDDQLELIHRAFPLKKWLASQELREDATERPNIDFPSICLRCHQDRALLNSHTATREHGTNVLPHTPSSLRNPYPCLVQDQNHIWQDHSYCSPRCSTVSGRGEEPMIELRSGNYMSRMKKLQGL